MTDILTELEADIGFSAAPGSRIDAVQRGADQEYGVLPPVPVIATGDPVEITGTPRVATADTTVYRTRVLAGNAYQPVLPQDPQRYAAVILPVDADIVLCDSKDLAQSPNNQTTSIPYPDGAYIPKGTQVVVRDKGACYAVNSSYDGNRVSMIIMRYENAAP